MAFPGTYNFNYYRGDTYEFKIYPKTSSGSVFDLSQYVALGAKFTVAPQRGAAGVADKKDCIATISSDFTNISCIITPEVGITLDPNIEYEYDVEISRVDSSGETPITYTYTLVTGSFSVTDHVTGATAEAI